LQAGARNASAAASYLKRAVALDPRLAPAWAQLCNLYEQEAAPPAAVLEAAEQAAKGQPEDAGAQVALARALARSGRHQDAEAAWQRARQLAPRVYGAMVGGMPWREEREESEPLLQMLSFLDQRAMMSIRWLMVELPGLPMGGWLGNPGAPQAVVAPGD
jgi:tetratricopeptide (TPR) repeat protein